MPVDLPNDLRHAVDVEGTPLKMVDSRTGNVYVLVDEEVFRRLRSLVGDDLSDTYRAQIESAMRGGWDDPMMDEYNNYDQHRQS